MPPPGGIVFSVFNRVSVEFFPKISIFGSMAIKNPKKTAAKPSSKPASQLDPIRWLEAALPLIAQKGWKKEILTLTAQKLKSDPALAAIVFPNGIKDLVQTFNSWLNDEMVAAIAASEAFPYMKVRQKVAFAVKARLKALESHVEAARQLIKWGLMPLNAPTVTHGLYQTVDTIWYEAGDTSTDYNFYTKRALLSAVYMSTLFFWMKDKSRGKEASWAFLDSRIDDVMQLGQKIGQAKQLGTIAEKFLKAKQRYGKA